MKRARDDIADAVIMQMDRRRRNHHIVLHAHEEEEEDHGRGHGHQSAAAPCFHDDVAFLSLSCGGGGSSSSSAEEATAGTCTAPPPPVDKRGRRRRRRRGRDGEAFECRTCGRQFATFQALGGHRTSHLRRPPAATKHNHRPKPMLVHACAMCGMDFSTGQALGGHMRRHRGTHEEDSSYVGLEQISVHERPSSASLQLLNLFV